MTELLSAAQMRAIEQAAIDRGEVTGPELMERAGRGVVDAVFAEWPELTEGQRRAVVLCGPGNNGGDGFVVARLLRERGWEVVVYLYGIAEKLPPDAKANCRRWAETGKVCAWDDAGIGELLGSLANDLVVDALLGTGATRSMPDDMRCTRRGFTRWVHGQTDQKYVAVDLPSGICSDSGKNLGGALAANLTVTFHRPKIGHYSSPDPLHGGGSAWCGKVVVADLGLTHSQPTTAVELVSKRVFHPGIDKFSGDHKYGHGHVLALSGPSGHGGAARLAARGALRIGAGLVTLACPPDALGEHAAQLNAIMVRPFVGADGLADILADERISAFVMGPGLGLSGATREKVAVALSARRKCVLDADALSIFENNDEDLFALCHQDVVLTPHAGEFRRLFPDIAESLAETPIRGPACSKVDATRAAAARAGCVVLFKGADTVIASPDGRCSINSAHYERSAPWLATAGSGDVLAGFIAGLMARGFAPMRAADSAAWLHVECARSFGPGLIAEDLPEELPKVFRMLGL
ncbi:MAG: NAD(P)H-hydrate dehydratase [Paracoccaceae bacterium]